MTDSTGQRGARRMCDVSPEYLQRLNAGDVEARSLAESLSVDFRLLMQRAVPRLSRKHRQLLDPAEPYMQRVRCAAQIAWEEIGLRAVSVLLHQPSDTLRGLVSYIVAMAPDLDLAERLRLVRPVADDTNPGVREFAWIGIRPRLAEQLEVAIALLTPWTTESSANLRRFATESVRPRGVWCRHIDRMKAEPHLALPLLEPLRSDPVKYVQDSVANFLNDASKSQPDFVRKLCRRWMRESKTPATARICRRALRTIDA